MEVSKSTDEVIAGFMEVKINGKKEKIENGLSLRKLLVDHNVRTEMVAVEINGMVIDRETYESTIINDGDEVEYLYYMCGGSKDLI